MKKLLCNYIPIFLLCFCLASCDKNKADDLSDIEWHDVKVAVVLPMEGGLDHHWKQTLTLFSENFLQSFRNQPKGIRLQFEFYDETTSDLNDLSYTLAHRDDITAVIGGQYSGDAQVMASILQPLHKTFFTIATTEELVRSHSSGGYLWAMTETDITQCEMLLSKAVYYGGESVSLLVNDNNGYGKTFTDWFAFQASELGLSIKGIYRYDDNSLKAISAEAAASGADFVICVPYETADIVPMLDAFEDKAVADGVVPRTLFSDTAFGSNIISLLGNKGEGLEGISFGSDPESGFDISYETYFGEQPALGEAQIYDAAMMIGYASFLSLLNPNLDLKESLRKIVDGRDLQRGSWMAEDMRNVIDELACGKSPNIRGASGSLDFDSKVYTNVLQTTYYHFKIYEGRFIFLDFLTTDGSKRSDATLASWNWNKGNVQDFEETSERTYPTLDQKWALLVAASTGWKNYRHQADVLAMYQILKKQGFSDDRIILIMEDDIAFNTINPFKGEIRVTPGGDNLYNGLIIDYNVSNLTPSDIQDILCGKRSEHLPHVINADENDNVLIFWSGHGNRGEFCWGNRNDAYTDILVKETLTQMAEQKLFRKLLFLAETCYSGSVASVCQGIPGALFITAANEYETSKADVYNEEMGIWMTNRFTSTLQEQIAINPSISLRDLYYKLFINTVGSHVKVYNAPSFGNVYKQSMSEFL